MTAAAPTLSRAQARRIALVAQGFRDPRHSVPTMRTFDRTLRRTGVLQIDSVNVLQRAHYMPLFSRMGPYDVDLLRRASERLSKLFRNKKLAPCNAKRPCVGVVIVISSFNIEKGETCLAVA